MVATDGDNKHVPLAAAIVKSEAEDSWSYFFRLAIQHMPQLNTGEMNVMSDRCKGITNTVEMHCSLAQHVYCTVHLARNVMTHCSSTGTREEVKRLIYEAAMAPLRRDFSHTLEAIKGLDQDAHAYLNTIDPVLWAQSFSKVRRFYVTTSNAVESLNGILAEDRKKGPLKLLVALYEWTFEKFGKRRTKAEEASSHHQEFTVRVQEMLENEAGIGRSHKCSINGAQVQVKDSYGKTFAVCLDLPGPKAGCSCGLYTMMGLPCSHIMAALAKCNPPRSASSWVIPCWKMATQLRLYTTLLPAIPTDDLEADEMVSTQQYMPSGSRRMKRLPSFGESAMPAQRRYMARTLTGQPVGIDSVRGNHADAIAAAPGGVQAIGGDKVLVHAHVVDVEEHSCDCLAFQRTGVCSHLRAAQATQPPDAGALEAAGIVSTKRLLGLQ